MKYIVLLAVAMSLAACNVSHEDVGRLMKQEGITEWSDDGFAFFGCSDSDNFQSAFHGKKNGQPVQGVICGGFAKGYTIRYR